MVKIFQLLVLFSIVFGFQSCKSDEVNPTFKMVYEMEFTTPPGLNAFETHFFLERDIATEIKKRASDAGISLTDITSIKTGACTLTSTFSAQNLAIMEEVTVDIYPSAEPQNVYEAAYSFAIPINTVNTIQLAGSLSDLSEVMTSDFFTTELGLRFRTTSQQEFNLRLNIEFNVFTES